MGKKSDKPDKVIPKRIAGMKLPKELRHAGDRLIATAQSPQGRAALAMGLGALANQVQARRAADTPPPRPGETRDAPPPDPVKVVQAVGIVANEVMGKLFSGKR